MISSVEFSLVFGHLEEVGFQSLSLESVPNGAFPDKASTTAEPNLIIILYQFGFGIGDGDVIDE